MNNPSDRPKRTRTVLLTIELCVNRAHGPFGAVEVISSLSREPWHLSKFWDLGEHGKLSSMQLNDFTAYLLAQVTEAAVTRLMVHDSFPGVLST